MLLPTVPTLPLPRIRPRPMAPIPPRAMPMPPRATTPPSSLRKHQASGRLVHLSSTRRASFGTPPFRFWRGCEFVCLTAHRVACQPRLLVDRPSRPDVSRETSAARRTMDIQTPPFLELHNAVVQRAGRAYSDGRLVSTGGRRASCIAGSERVGKIYVCKADHARDASLAPGSAAGSVSRQQACDPCGREAELGRRLVDDAGSDFRTSAYGGRGGRRVVRNAGHRRGSTPSTCPTSSPFHGAGHAYFSFRRIPRLRDQPYRIARFRDPLLTLRRHLLYPARRVRNPPRPVCKQTKISMMLVKRNISRL